MLDRVRALPLARASRRRDEAAAQPRCDGFKGVEREAAVAREEDGAAPRAERHAADRALDRRDRLVTDVLVVLVAQVDADPQLILRRGVCARSVTARRRIRVVEGVRRVPKRPERRVHPQSEERLSAGVASLAQWRHLLLLTSRDGDAAVRRKSRVAELRDALLVLLGADVRLQSQHRVRGDDARVFTEGGAQPGLQQFRRQQASAVQRVSCSRTSRLHEPSVQHPRQQHRRERHVRDVAEALRALGAKPVELHACRLRQRTAHDPQQLAALRGKIGDR